ncbi:MAG: VOC family protein, partial [Acetobacteraceae bacterium]
PRPLRNHPGSARELGMTTFTWEHIHLRSPNPEATATWYERMLGAEIIRTPQPDGSTRLDLDLGGGQKVFIAPANPNLETAAPPRTPYFGLEHIGLTVADIDGAVRELKGKGVTFTTEPTTVRPGARIAFMRGPEDVLIELIQRG